MGSMDNNIIIYVFNIMFFSGGSGVFNYLLLFFNIDLKYVYV